MPNPQNRNNRRKQRKGYSETLIIPHITKEMLEKARTMAEHGASRAEIEQAIAQMQAAQNPAAATPAQEAPQDTESHRIVPTSRPRYTEEERKALLAQMQQEQEQKEAERRAEATRRTERPAWKIPTPKAPRIVNRTEPVQQPAEPETQPETQSPKPAPQPVQPVEEEPTRTITASQPAAPVEEPTRTVETPRAAAPQPAAQPSAAPQQTAAPKASQASSATPAKRQAGLLHSRAEAEAQLKEKIRSDHVWLSNPVMVRGLGLAPVVGAALDGERALMLCIACLLLITFTRVFAVAICHLSGNRFRPVIYCYTAAVLYIPVYILLYNLFGNDLTVLGIYLPILVAEPAIVKRMEFTELEPIRDAFRHGFNNGIGMCVALLIVGCLRELLGTGALFGHAVLNTALLPLASQPAGGFVLVGVIAAVWCAVANAYTDYKQEEVRRLYANRKH